MAEHPQSSWKPAFNDWFTYYAEKPVIVMMPGYQSISIALAMVIIWTLLDEKINWKGNHVVLSLFHGNILLKCPVQKWSQNETYKPSHRSSDGSSSGLGCSKVG